MTNLALLERMPIFPLPDFVVFPGTPVPLHFFEPRYRALIEDVVAGDGMMVTVRLGPYTPSEYQGAPPVEPVGTLTRVVAHRARPNGTHDAVLLGLGRVTVEPFTVTERGYRLAKVALMDEELEVARDVHTALVACASRLITLLRARHPDLKLDIDADTPAARVVDTLADRFVGSADARSRLLAETNASVRAERVLEALAALTVELEPSGSVS